MKSVQKLYYVLSCRLLLFTRQNRKMKREVFSAPSTEATSSAIMIEEKKVAFFLSFRTDTAFLS